MLSLPSNFTYNPPGTKVTLEQKPSQARRQTLHSHQPITLLNMDDIRSIDESVSDIYSIQEYKTSEMLEKNHRQQIQQTNLDEIVSLKSVEDRFPLKRINETNENNRLGLPLESKPKFYGSTKHLFTKQLSMDVSEETPFLQTLSVPEQIDKKLPKHDSQESVQRIITERRKLDENLKEFNEYDIFDVAHSSEENLVDKDEEQRGMDNDSSK